MSALTPLLLGTLLKGTVILAMALVLSAALRRAPGLARHRLWSLAFTALLLLPALVTALPPLPLPVPAPLASLGAAVVPLSPAAAEEAGQAPAHEEGMSAADPAGRAQRSAGLLTARGTEAGALLGGLEAAEATPTVPGERPAASSSSDGRRAGSLIGRHGPTTVLAVWLAGVAIAMAFLLTGLARAARDTRRARRVTDESWLRDLEWHRNFFGIRRCVRLLESERVRTPMTGGVLRPTVLVPQGAAAWSEERRRLVLLHELVHIRRYDVVRHWLARLGVALYWFHPLAWLAARGSAIAREQACDEEVLRLGVKPSVYARQLFELAQGLHSGRVPAAALPMIQRSQLEKRLMTILDPKARRHSARTSAAAAVLMVLTAVSVAMAVPQEEPAAAAMGPAALIAPQSSACWPYDDNRSWQYFSGSISTRDDGGVRRVDAVGTADGQRIVQQWVDDLRLCMRASGDVALDDDGAIGAIGDGANLILEAELGGLLQRLTIRNDGGSEQLTWTVNGAPRPLTEQVERWRDRMTTVLNEQARIATLRGRRASLRGQIASIRGQRASLRGQIASIRGQRASLRGQISSINGRQSSLRGEISSARGHVSSLRGEISRHRSAMRGLQASRYGASEEELAVIEAAQRRHQEAIAELERQIEDYDLEGKVEEIESRMNDDLEAGIAGVEEQIAALAVERQVAEIEQQIEALDVEGRAEEIERQIEALNVDERVREIAERLEPTLRELRSTIESIR